METEKGGLVAAEVALRVGGGEGVAGRVVWWGGRLGEGEGAVREEGR